MVKYRGPRVRLVRRLGKLPGLTKKNISKKKESKTPGQHGKTADEQKKQKSSAYKVRLHEKQKLRYNYGISELQLLKYVKEAKRKRGLTGFLLMQLLEMRLDNIIFKIGIAPTIPAARQLINHGHILVNKRKVNIPSFQCRPNDIISFLKRVQTTKLIERNLKEGSCSNSNNKYLEFDQDSLTIKINNLIERKEIDFEINDMLVVEYYSRLL